MSDSNPPDLLRRADVEAVVERLAVEAGDYGLPSSLIEVCRIREAIAALPPAPEGEVQRKPRIICPRHGPHNDPQVCPQCWDEQREAMFNASQKGAQR